jgi:hypothetical protein
MRLPSAYLIAHNGLGDNVFMIGCLHFLANFYDDVYFLCKDMYKSQLEYALADWPFIHVVPFDTNRERESCYKILADKYETSDVFVCGVCHTCYLGTKITHPFLKDPSMLYRVFPGGFETFMRETYRRRLPHIKGEYQWSHPSGEFPLPETYKFMDMFYRDIGLSPMISSDFFMISQVDDVSQLYQDIAQYRIIFLTTSCGTTDELFDFSEYMDPFRDNQDYIVICSNKNYYDAVDPRYDIAQRYIMLPTIFHYMEILKNAEMLCMSDSCISCLVVQLIRQGHITTRDIHIQNRVTGKETDLSLLYDDNV